uniref:Lipoxygenase domain-containing protein n=1 Tax=Anser cygnoides TaxID=8845 RepID=A0A8B9IP35_ANSCY
QVLWFPWCQGFWGPLLLGVLGSPIIGGFGVPPRGVLGSPLWGRGGPGAGPAEYVVRHWRDDAFFGEQYLSGVNPVLLRRCPRLTGVPGRGSWCGGPTVAAQGGRVFVADYALLEGLPTGRIGDEPQFTAAPLCLLWLSPAGRLLPLAIQLLLPHSRYTFHINILARDKLLNPGGIIDQASAIGREGALELVARATAALTYAELCVPDDIERRGVADVPNYHYRDDALEIWGAIESFVEGIVGLYYHEDSDVVDDPELQDWVGEIFTYAVLGNEKSGFPAKLCSRPELVKFLTMIIFRCSAQHAAVNSGQYDFYAWMPNSPGTMRCPPPRSKAGATAESFLATLPSPAATGALLALLSVVSYEAGERVSRGGSPPSPPRDSNCPQCPPRRRLARISRRVQRRNAALPLPYPYLDPAAIENSIAI